jgi:hypothetical protein
MASVCTSLLMVDITRVCGNTARRTGMVFSRRPMARNMMVNSSRTLKMGPLKTFSHLGEFTNGMENGPGKKIHANKDEYHGNWLNGKLHGFGVYKFAGGERYEGEYKGGMRHGRGVFTSRSGRKYDGSSSFQISLCCPAGKRT